MFCAYCGSQNPDEARFCANCGAAISPAARPQQARPVQQPNPPVNKKPAPAPVKKKKNSNWVIPFVLILFFGGCSFAMYATSNAPKQEMREPSYVQNNSAPENTAPIYVSPSVTCSQEYRIIFESSGLTVPTTNFLISPYEVSAYAAVLDGGVVEDMEFEHKNGIVQAMVDTVYIPVSGLDEATREAVHLTMMESLSAYEQMDCCMLTSHKGADYFVYRLEVMDMDDLETVRMITSAGMISVTNDSDLVGISATEESLLASGYVKR